MRFILSLVALSLLITGSAQTLTGKLADSLGKPVAGGTVSCNLSDSLIVGYAVSGDDGGFRFNNVKPGKYFLRVAVVGFVPYTSSVFQAEKTNLDMPVFMLHKASLDLQEVKVSARRPMIDVQPDKLVFNIENSINAIGNNALELLQKAPGIVVDKDDNITISGKVGVKVYIDGKPSPLSSSDLAAYLRSMSSTDIEAIEIITNPSARYEAAGTAGIINIRLKKNKNLGTNASISAGWSVSTFAKYAASISLNHRTKNVNTFGTYSYNEGINASALNLYRFQADSIYDQRAQTTLKAKSHNARLGADWFLNSKQTLGLLLNGNFANNDIATSSRTPITAQSASQISRSLEANSFGDRKRSSVTANLNYHYIISQEKSLSADADYGYYDIYGKSYVPNVYTDKNGQPISTSIFGNITPVRIALYSVKSDYEQNVLGGKLSAGFKSAFVKTDNQFDFFNYVNELPIPDASRSNRFNYTEQIHAVYTQFQKQVKKLNYQAGLRLEQTISRGELKSNNIIDDRDVKRHYLNLFPSGGFTYQLNQKNSVGASFSRRIDRPTYQDLNPFESRIDELTYQKGNPFLRPQYTNNVEIRHTYNYTLNSSLSYSSVTDLFASITDTIEGQRNYISQRNLAHQKVLSATVSYPFSITKWWSVYANAGVSYNRYKAEFDAGKKIDIETVVANLYQQQTFLINKKITGEISGFYQSPYVWGGSYKCKSIWSLDLGISHKVLKDMGTIKLSCSDVFRKMPWSGVSRFGGLVINGSGAWESRLFKVNFAYRFGNSQVKAARQRASAIEELNNRIQ